MPNKGTSSQFCERLSKFLDGIASQIDKLLFNVAEDSTRSFLQNFDYLTRNQFDKFVELVWMTYDRAEI